MKGLNAMKDYVISYSAIFQMAFGHPWVVKCEGSTDTWKFATEKEARDFVKGEGGNLVKVCKGEKGIYERWKQGRAD